MLYLICLIRLTNYLIWCYILDDTKNQILGLYQIIHPILVIPILYLRSELVNKVHWHVYPDNE